MIGWQRGTPQEAPASVLEVRLASHVSGAGGGDIGGGNGSDGAMGEQSAGEKVVNSGDEKSILVLQARSRRETFLWAKVLQV